MIADDLLRAVIEHPGDNAVRLVLADAWIQAGDPRGELIARQCATPPDRAPELVEQVRPLWQEVLGAEVTEFHFDRGMPFSAQVWVANTDGDALAPLDLAPLEHVALRFDEDSIERDPAAHWFARDPRTSRIRTLDLTWERWDSEALHAILAADLRGVRALAIGDYDSQLHAAHALIASTTLAPESLAVYGDSYGDFTEGLALLAEWPRSATIEQLTLDNTGLGPEAARSIASSPHFANLRSLGLTGGSNTTNRIGDAGLVALARSPHLDKLEDLVVVLNEIGDEGVLALADPSVLPALTSIALNGCRFSCEAFIRLVEARPFRSLYVGGCFEIGDAGVTALARSPHVRGLQGLNLYGADVGADGIHALIASPIEKLEYLGIKADPELTQLLVDRFGAAAVAGA
ncbi:MAG: TIGR02996 domain-containing protein [Kofleriaceae bacterium]